MYIYFLYKEMQHLIILFAQQVSFVAIAILSKKVPYSAKKHWFSLTTL